MRTLLPGLLAALLLVTGCTSLPVEGPVELGEASTPSGASAPFDFNPPGPRPGATPEQVVGGFLQALQATPPTLRVAHEFLTEEAVADWRPDRRTIVYTSQSSSAGAGVVRVELEDAFELDEHGRYVGAREAASPPLTFQVVREDDEWRIASLPDAMVIPRSHFQARYLPFSLYFFDPTGSVLVPEQVHLPRGVQAPTLLVAGLLAGPTVAAQGVERSYLPAGTRLGVSVPVGSDGLAEVQLTPEIRELPQDQLERAVAQLAWTLRQVGQVQRFEITVDGTPVELPGGPTVEVEEMAEYAPSVAAASTDLFGLRRRQVVQVVGNEEKTAVPLAVAFHYRSLGIDLPGAWFALVTRDGSAVDVVSREGVESARRSYTGTDVLRPMWDHTGRTWLVDRTPTGPQVVLVEKHGVRTLPAPGLADERVLGASLSRDGTRLALTVRGDGDGVSRLLMARVVRRDGGQPVRLAGLVELATPAPLDGGRDLGWRDPTTVAVLTRPTESTSQVMLASIDGSSGSVGPVTPTDVLFDAGVALAASPGDPMALVVRTRSGGLHALDLQGRWDFDAGEPGLRAPAFVG
ncbi:MAG TPA: LpqB family beta-propeller domain-containing protein [Marmoricola sp.]|nr:LpqB family beta-propeller domain-containing protein [Marmoricola sp.]